MTELTKERRKVPRNTDSDAAFDAVRKLLREANETGAALHVTCTYLQARYDSACEVIAKHITGGTKDRAAAMVERYRVSKGEA